MLEKETHNKHTHCPVVLDSGAKGNMAQILELAGMVLPFATRNEPMQLTLFRESHCCSFCTRRSGAGIVSDEGPAVKLVAGKCAQLESRFLSYPLY